VLTIIDQWAYNHFKVEHKLQGIAYHKWINLEDAEDESIYPHLEASHSFIKDKLQEHNVLVHCQMGISRSSSLVIAFLMKEFGMSFNKARELVRSKREIICPN
jgi:protein-tyrosine phosphatase